MSVKDVSPELLADAGLSEKETQIYLAILGLGNATIGQISQITGLNIFETSELLPNLENLEYVKKLPGILNRYIPMEPFLRAFVDIDKRFQIDMAQLKDALNKNVDEFITNIDNTYGNMSRIFDLAQDRCKPPHILSTTETKLGELFSEQKTNYVAVKDKGTETLKRAIADLSDKLMKEVGERQGLVGQITLGAIDAVKTSLEASRQSLSLLSSDLSSELQNEAEELKSHLFSILDQQVESYDHRTQGVLQEVEKIVDKYQEEFARASTYLKEDFTRLANRQAETIKKDHETLQSSLRDVFNDIAKDWNRTTSQVQPELDNIDTAISVLGQRLRNLGEEIRTIKVGFRKPFPQEEVAAKTDTLADALETIVNDTKTLLEKLNVPIEAALSGSQTMTRKTEELISEVTTNTRAELETLKQDAEERIVGTLRDFKADLVEENREKLADFYSTVKKLATSTKERVDSELAERLTTQIGYVQQFIPKADHLHTEAANHVELELTRVRKETDVLLTDHGKTIQALFQEKATEIGASWGAHLDEFHTKTDSLQSEIMKQLTEHFETQTTDLENAVVEIHTVIEPVITQVKELGKEVERDVGEKIVATVMRTKAAEKALKRVQDESTKIKPVVTATTWALLGKQNLQPLVNDMLARTKSSITIVLPQLSTDLLKRIAELPRSRKITLVSEIDIDQYEIELGHLLDQGNVQLRHYTKKDINLCLRDAEEVFLAIEAPEEEFVTILTENEDLVRLLQKIMLSEFVSIAKPVRF